MDCTIITYIREGVSTTAAPDAREPEDLSVFQYLHKAMQPREGCDLPPTVTAWLSKVMVRAMVLSGDEQVAAHRRVEELARLTGVAMVAIRNELRARETARAPSTVTS